MRYHTGQAADRTAAKGEARSSGRGGSAPPPQRREPGALRSHRWLGPDDLRSFGHRSRMKQMGFGPEDYQGKPVIAILNTWSEFNTCHTHFRERAQDVKRGVFQAGGVPVEGPGKSLSQ